MTMTLISTVIVGAGGASSIDFTSIPQTYTDLQLLISTRETGATTSGSIYLSFNSVAGTSYTTRWLQGNGSSTLSANSSGVGATGFLVTVGANATSNTFSNGSIYIPNYTSSNNKSGSFDSVGENNATAIESRIGAGIFTNTSAITSLSLATSTGSIAQYSSASLYGITKGSGGATVS